LPITRYRCVEKGLAFMAWAFLQMNVKKGHINEPWNKNPLSVAQITYAALDAEITRRLFFKMKNLPLSYEIHTPPGLPLNILPYLLHSQSTAQPRITMANKSSKTIETEESEDATNSATLKRIEESCGVDKFEKSTKEMEAKLIETLLDQMRTPEKADILEMDNEVEWEDLHCYDDGVDDGDFLHCVDYGDPYDCDWG